MVCIIGTTYGRSITDVKAHYDEEFDENNWVNDPQYPDTDRKNFANGIYIFIVFGRGVYIRFIVCYQ